MKLAAWILAGFFGGGFLAAVIGFSLPEVMVIPQASGGYAMGVAFFWVPLAAVLGGVAGLVRGLRG